MICFKNIKKILFFFRFGESIICRFDGLARIDCHHQLFLYRFNDRWGELEPEIVKSRNILAHSQIKGDII